MINNLSENSHVQMKKCDITKQGGYVMTKSLIENILQTLKLHMTSWCE